MSATTRVSSPTASLSPDALSAFRPSLQRSHPGGAVPPPAEAALGGSTAGATTASMTSGASKLRRPPPLAAEVSTPPPAAPVPGRSSPDAHACVPGQHNACKKVRGGGWRLRTACALKRGPHCTSCVCRCSCPQAAPWACLLVPGHVTGVNRVQRRSGARVCGNSACGVRARGRGVSNSGGCKHCRPTCAPQRRAWGTPSCLGVARGQGLHAPCV